MAGPRREPEVFAGEQEFCCPENRRQSALLVTANGLRLQSGGAAAAASARTKPLAGGQLKLIIEPRPRPA
jgi:hypothetical protein